jgi:hypothetical protein
MWRWGAIGLALATGALLLLDPLTPSSEKDPAGTRLKVARLTESWPHARVVKSPARLADGVPYTPLSYLDAGTSLGTAPTSDGTAVRLLLRGQTGEPKELRRIAIDRSPKFSAFAIDGEWVHWVELTGAARSLWRADVRTGTAPVPLTSDTGEMLFRDSQYDLVVGEGKVHWVAAAPGDDRVTEVRSVPVAGGMVTTKRVDGKASLSAWPWLIVTGDAGSPVQLRNLSTGATVRPPVGINEVVSCSASWCRAIIVAQDGAIRRFDLMRPDGSQRRQVAAAEVTAAVVDVAILDRFDLVSYLPDPSVMRPAQLLLYDLRSATFTLISEAAVSVGTGNGVLWWSEPGKQAGDSYALDLRTL